MQYEQGPLTNKSRVRNLNQRSRGIKPTPNAIEPDARVFLDFFKEKKKDLKKGKVSLS